MRTYPDTLVSIIDSSGMNVNQISKISGISNTYLTKLVRKKINHPGKDKIASVLLALNYTISDINTVLADYDYMPLNEHDIPAILENNRKRKFEGRIVPHYDYIYFELLMAALENLGGTKIIVKNRPSGIFIPMDLYLQKEFPQESDDEAAVFFRTFTREVVAERKRLFLENCAKGERFITYMCKGCLEESLDRRIGARAQAEDMERVTLYSRYFANAVAATLKSPDQHLHKVVRRCTHFQYQLQDADGPSPKVSFTANRQHYFHKEWEQLNIEGFLSDAPNITELFFKEVDKCRDGLDETHAVASPQGFADYIRSQFDLHRALPLFDRELQALMDDHDLVLH
jgi:transcriptional regulator with XRE-family HTH domain